MTDQPAKKTATRKPRPRKTAETKPAAEVMDPTANEVAYREGEEVDVQAHAPFSARNCWSINTLIEEVAALYPEVTHSITEVTPRKVGVTVEFAGWDDSHKGNEPGLPAVLSTIEGDPRVAEVVSATSDDQGDNPTVTVRIRVNPVTMDQREEFGINAAYTIMTDGE